MKVANNLPYGVKTKLIWAKSGYMVMPGVEGELMWTNQYCGLTAVYYNREEVYYSPEEATEYLRNRRREKRRAIMMEKKKEASELARRKAIAPSFWRRFIGPEKTVLIFDTETTGLNCYYKPGTSQSYD